MSLPIFLRGLILLIVAFAIVTYVITGSAWATFIDTVICAILVQVGYFALVLFLVWREAAISKPERSGFRRDAANGFPSKEPAAQLRSPPSTPKSRNP
jgi:exopolysaccharide production repressor protein